MLRVLTLAAALAVAAAPATAQSLKEFLDKARERWDAPAEPFRVIGNIHFVGTVGLSSYLITTPEGHILIDTVMPGKTNLITANVEKLGFKVADIKVMINTHAHIDHTGNFADLKKVTNAQMISGVKDKPLLESGTYPGRESETELNFATVKVDRTVTDGDVVALGTTKLTAHATPGHSPGCTSWSMDVTENGKTEGVVFFCSGTVALNKLVGAPTHAGIVDDYKKTLTTAGNIKGDVLLAPHPEMFGLDAKRAAMAPGAPNPFVKPGEFQTYLAKLKGDFDTALAKQEAAVKK